MPNFECLASTVPEIRSASWNSEIGSRDPLVTPIDLIFHLFSVSSARGPYCRPLAERSKWQKYEFPTKTIFGIVECVSITRTYRMPEIRLDLIVFEVAKRSKQQILSNILCHIEVTAITMADGSNRHIIVKCYILASCKNTGRKKQNHQPIVKDVLCLVTNQKTCCVDSCGCLLFRQCCVFTDFSLISTF